MYLSRLEDNTGILTTTDVTTIRLKGRLPILTAFHTFMDNHLSSSSNNKPQFIMLVPSKLATLVPAPTSHSHMQLRSPVTLVSQHNLCREWFQDNL